MQVYILFVLLKVFENKMLREIYWTCDGGSNKIDSVS